MSANYRIVSVAFAVAFFSAAQLPAQTQVPADKSTIGNTAGWTITVYVLMGTGGADLKPVCAEGIASRILAEAGVRIKWRSGEPKTEEGDASIAIYISSRTPATFHPAALAYAYPFGDVPIRVFWDRIRDPLRPQLANSLLAHVMAHEITHVLEGTDRHSRDGLMKARWTEQDLNDLAYRHLQFAPEDIELIHSGLLARRERAARRTRPANSTF